MHICCPSYDHVCKGILIENHQSMNSENWFPQPTLFHLVNLHVRIPRAQLVWWTMDCKQVNLTTRWAIQWPEEGQLTVRSSRQAIGRSSDVVIDWSVERSRTRALWREMMQSWKLVIKRSINGPAERPRNQTAASCFLRTKTNLHICAVLKTRFWKMLDIQGSTITKHSNILIFSRKLVRFPGRKFIDICQLKTSKTYRILMFLYNLC